MLFLRRQSLLWLLLVVRVKLLFWITSKIRDHVLMWEKSQQFAGEVAVSDNVISCCQVNKHNAGLLLSLKRVLGILHDQNTKQSLLNLHCCMVCVVCICGVFFWHSIFMFFFCEEAICLSIFTYQLVLC